LRRSEKLSSLLLKINNAWNFDQKQNHSSLSFKSKKKLKLYAQIKEQTSLLLKSKNSLALSSKVKQSSLLLKLKNSPA
jgi:hypothetical protein